MLCAQLFAVGLLQDESSKGGGRFFNRIFLASEVVIIFHWGFEDIVVYDSTMA